MAQADPSAAPQPTPNAPFIQAPLRDVAAWVAAFDLREIPVLSATANSLEDLVTDARFPKPVRHLRKIFADPITGTTRVIKDLHDTSLDLPASVDDVVATTTVGWILILAGALGIVLGLIATRSRSHTTVVEERREV